MNYFKNIKRIIRDKINLSIEIIPALIIIDTGIILFWIPLQWLPEYLINILPLSEIDQTLYRIY